tara:strand:- start:3501 stop:4142 length:642 start_codon:yes stop_codon:yes gene_type:complete
MSIKDKYKVESINSQETYDWLLHKHYAKRIPSISYAFGLFKNKELLGICTFGSPASPSLCIGVCGKEYKNKVIELNRLCIEEGLENNVASFFVSFCLNMFKKEQVVVSYADSDMKHNGYIYQATNWIYTGATKERTDIGFDDNSHSRHYDKNIDYSKNRKKRSSKHRYVYFIGSKKQKNKMLKNLKYEIHPYPKGENKRYDASYKPVIQKTLF